MELSIVNLIELIRLNPECSVLVSCGLPKIDEGVVLPEDVETFYKNCGGIVFFSNSEYPFSVVSPNEFVKANPVIVGELCEDDISSMWYIVCKDDANNYLTIDLSEKRNGKCYDSFWDRHGVAGACMVIANSFTELIYQLFCSKGETLFWLDEAFEYMGDAYDD